MRSPGITAIFRTVGAEWTEARQRQHRRHDLLWRLVRPGTVYTLASSGHYNVLYSFKGSPDGYGPGGLILYNGNYYGLTNRGGLYDGGSVFEITPSGQEHVVYSFGRDKLDGWFPVGMMLYDGKFYGTTYYGGGQGGGWGTVFEVSPDGEERILHRFGGPKGRLCRNPRRRRRYRRQALHLLSRRLL